jgi:hypothetical protein
VSDLDALLSGEDEEPAGGSRGRQVAGTFAFAVVAAAVIVVLLALPLAGDPVEVRYRRQRARNSP